ncbi:MAG: FHA domain-containing protein [Rubrivivax sp.]|nr:FHA domain-containing protein [Rubrivivax sp.]
MLLLKLVRGLERAAGVRTLAQVSPRHVRFVIGRDPKCDWPIPDRELALSARHCEIVQANGQPVLRDLSTNGTFVNGSRKRLAGDHVLRHGDRIAFGSYLVEVAHAADADLAAPPAALARTRLRPRGGDPAAAVGTDWQQAEALGPAPSLDMSSGFTRISKPWLDTSTEAQSSVFATVPNVRPDAGPSTFEDTASPAAVPPAVPDAAGEMLRALAAGLGVAPEALAGGHPAEAAHRVARLLRVSMFALHHQLALQSRQMRELGSRASADLGSSATAPLRRAAGPQDAVATLLAAGSAAEAMVVRAHGELGQHTQRILAAFESTCQQLAEQLDPATLAHIAPAGDDPAVLWQTYGALWQALGFGAGKPWAEGYVDAAFMHLATAYDESPAPGKTPT